MAASSMHSARLLPLILVVAASLGGAAADDHLVFSNYTCSAPEKYTSDSTYAKNLAKLLSTLSRPAAADVDNWWFRTGTVISASRDDQVSGLAMCFADSEPDRCRSCLATLSRPDALFPACERSRDVGFISSDGCVIRYAGGGAPFFGNAADEYSGASLVLRMITLVDDAAAMRDARRALLSRLAESAGGDERRFATGSQGYMTTDAAGRRTWQVMYGMAQCTRDLPSAECSGCLLDQLALMYRVVSVTNSTEASVRGLSCYLRYQVNKPINIAGIAVPPATPPTAVTPTGSSAPPSPVDKTTAFIAALAAAAVTLFSVGV